MRNPYDEFSDKHGGRHREQQMDAETAKELLEDLQLLVAHAVASALDAGSERDAVIEDEDLGDALYKLIRGWWEIPDPAFDNK